MEITVVKCNYSNNEDMGKILNDPNNSTVGIYIVSEITSIFSLTSFIKSLNNINSEIKCTTLFVPYLSDGALTIDVEQKLIRSILRNYKIIFTNE